MPDFLGHAENPLREEEWARLNETVIQVARRSLVGRRILDIYGPLGAGVQTVPHDEYQGVSAGAVDIVGEQETAMVFTDARKFKTIPIIYKDFLLHWRDIEAARIHNMPLDVSAAAGAAALCAQQEDELIFYGDPRLGHEGLMTANGRLTVPLGRLDAVRAPATWPSSRPPGSSTSTATTAPTPWCSRRVCSRCCTASTRRRACSRSRPSASSPRTACTSPTACAETRAWWCPPAARTWTWPWPWTWSPRTWAPRG